ncbi:hypothetical protein A4D02_19650 [Niastella koreensis]|nr:hypothetical protein A4D02_19650 [Niastella koreensis]
MLTVHVLNMIFKYTGKFYETTILNIIFTAMYVRLIQAVFITIAFVGWIVYQMAVRKKRFSEISNDILAIVFFAAVWIGLCYWLLK